MSEREISKLLKFLLEFGPVLVFFVGYLWLRDESFTIYGVEYAGFIVVTALFVPLCVIAMAASWRLTGKIAKMQAVTTVLVVVFGFLTVWFNDERFFKIKPTLIYLLFAAILVAGLLRKRSALQYALEDALPFKTRAGWLMMTRHTVFFCLALAVVNELIWRHFSTDIWVSFKTFGLPVLTMVFFVADTYFVMNSQEEKTGSSQESSEV